MVLPGYSVGLSRRSANGLYEAIHSAHCWPFQGALPRHAIRPDIASLKTVDGASRRPRTSVERSQPKQPRARFIEVRHGKLTLLRSPVRGCSRTSGKRRSRRRFTWPPEADAGQAHPLDTVIATEAACLFDPFRPRAAMLGT